MKQFIAILLPIIIICFNTLFAQDRNLVIPVRAAVTEDLNPPYTGRGWHRVHKRPVKKLLAKSPSRKTNICPDCHKKNAYRVNDPHTQLSEGGDIIKEKCLYCHPEKPDEKSATFTVLRPEIKFNRDLKELCLGCHSRQYDFSHPVNANHLLIPSDEMLSMMKASEAQFGVILPLNFNGEIMCATCHNPHERGVIPAEKAASRGASEKFRVRPQDYLFIGYDLVAVRIYVHHSYIKVTEVFAVVSIRHRADCDYFGDLSRTSDRLCSAGIARCGDNYYPGLNSVPNCQGFRIQNSIDIGFRAKA